MKNASIMLKKEAQTVLFLLEEYAVYHNGVFYKSRFNKRQLNIISKLQKENYIELRELNLEEKTKYVPKNDYEEKIFVIRLKEKAWEDSNLIRKQKAEKKSAI